MADTKISALTAITGASIDTAADAAPVVDTSVTTTKKILYEQMAIALEIEGSSVASATTCNIWTVGQSKHITGTTTITSFGTANKAGEWRKLIFDDAVLLTHGADLNIQSAQNYTTQAGDLVLVYADTTTQFDVFIVTSGTTAASATGVSLTSDVAANVTSISLTPGKWNVFASATFVPAGTTVVFSLLESISTTSATLDTAVGKLASIRHGSTGIVPGGNETIASVAARETVSATTTYYLVALGSFGTSTMTVGGKIWAERRS